jgi:hypothetical protein
MAAESPGWCKRCGEPIEQSQRAQGRAREFCDAGCRKAYSRTTALHRSLAKEVGLNDQQISRLLSLFTVTPRRPKRDASATRSASGSKA